MNGGVIAMASEFQTRISGPLDLLFTRMGVPGVYTGANSSEVRGTIRIHRNDSSQVVRDTKVSGETQTADIFARQSEFAKPARGGRFLVDGVEVWTVEKEPTLKNGQWTITCTRSSAERMMERRAKQNG